MATEDGLESLFDVLKEVQLEHFFVRIRDDLQITALSHFDNDHVRIEDFEKIGMGPPGARRLMDAVKKRRSKLQKEALLKKIIPKKNLTQKSSIHGKSRSSFHTSLPAPSCLINYGCWAKDPTNRPTFQAIKEFFQLEQPELLRAIKELGGAGRLTLSEGDIVAVIDGDTEKYWWKGQHQGNYKIGMFPRCFMDASRRKSPADISKPIRNSFVHAGHGAIQGDSWGEPGRIDELYLQPVDPPDLLGLQTTALQDSCPLDLPNRKKRESEECDEAFGATAESSVQSVHVNSNSHRFEVDNVLIGLCSSMVKGVKKCRHLSAEIRHGRGDVSMRLVGVTKTGQPYGYGRLQNEAVGIEECDVPKRSEASHSLPKIRATSEGVLVDLSERNEKALEDVSFMGNTSDLYACNVERKSRSFYSDSSFESLSFNDDDSEPARATYANFMTKPMDLLLTNNDGQKIPLSRYYSCVPETVMSPESALGRSCPSLNRAASNLGFGWPEEAGASRTSELDLNRMCAASPDPFTTPDLNNLTALLRPMSLAVPNEPLKPTVVNRVLSSTSVTRSEASSARPPWLDLDPISNPPELGKSRLLTPRAAQARKSDFDDDFVDFQSQATSLPSSPRRGGEAPVKVNNLIPICGGGDRNKIPIRPEVTMAIAREIQMRQIQAEKFQNIRSPESSTLPRQNEKKLCHTSLEKEPLERIWPRPPTGTESSAPVKLLIFPVSTAEKGSSVAKNPGLGASVTTALVATLDALLDELAFPNPPAFRPPPSPPKLSNGSLSATNDLVAIVVEQVNGVTVSEARAVLTACNNNVQAAVQRLKIDKLSRIGVGSRTDCENCLKRFNWNLEIAASALLDHVEQNL
ncbi:unnamed protein product [Notodromas monacha]|uniref:non-specific protein-tyrosine kinase n=1 Tax=Notodromas monacha TaxID=399045 RepID=A0A7R9BJZ0_9CRUS|nr:unnamed protein product [Notodromas monacha]CAG0915773.1 unnamed protein product [Notodromas monacha]